MADQDLPGGGPQPGQRLVNLARVPGHQGVRSLVRDAGQGVGQGVHRLLATQDAGPTLQERHLLPRGHALVVFQVVRDTQEEVRHLDLPSEWVRKEVDPQGEGPGRGVKKLIQGGHGAIRYHLPLGGSPTTSRGGRARCGSGDTLAFRRVQRSWCARGP